MCAQVGAKFSADITARLARLTILPFSRRAGEFGDYEGHGPEAP
jgi:hypothetical protein